MRKESVTPNALHRILSVLCVFIIILMTVGCGTTSQPTPTVAQQVVPTSAPPTSTNTPALTETPLPTDTPVPTDTPTPLPTDTATPDLQATQAFIATQAADQLIVDIKAQLKEFGFPTDVGHLGWAQTEPETITLSTYGDYFYTPFAEDLTASDFILRTDVTWETEGLVMCGLIFRSEPNFEKGAQYSFLYLRISGLPAWAIEYYDNGDFVSTVTDVKFSSAIDMKNGAMNNLILAAEGNKFTLFINGDRVGSFFDWSSERTDGKFAFQGTQEKGPSTCTFNNTWVWMLK
jgi:hypothetical protein